MSKFTELLDDAGYDQSDMDNIIYIFETAYGVSPDDIPGIIGTLKMIASCKTTVKGDTVDLAQQAIRAAGVEL